MDITHYRLADDTEVEILNILDDHSRLCVARTARGIFLAADVNTVFTTTSITARWLACSVTTAVFTGAPRRGGGAALELTCRAR